MQITIETFEDLKYLNSKETWALIKEYEEKRLDIPLNILLSSQMSSKLIEDPQNIESYTVNGFVIETTDCYKRHYLRIKEIYENWICYRDINSFNCDMSWQPSYIKIEVIKDNNNITYSLDTESLELFKLQKNDDSI